MRIRRLAEMNRAEGELGEVDERSEEIPLCGAKPRRGEAKTVTTASAEALAKAEQLTFIVPCYGLVVILRFVIAN